MHLLMKKSQVICNDRKFVLLIPKPVLVGLRWIKIKKENKNFQVEVIPNLKDGTILLRRRGINSVTPTKYMDRIMAWLHFIHRKKAIEEIRKNRGRLSEKIKNISFPITPKKQLEKEHKKYKLE